MRFWATQPLCLNLLFVSCACFGLLSQAHATEYLANFDDQPIGQLFNEDGGILFSYQSDLQGFPNELFISSASTSTDGTDFSPPHVAVPDGFAGNGGLTFGYLGVLGFSIPQPANYAQLDVFYSGLTGGNTLTLQGISNGQVLATENFLENPSSPGVNHVLLSLAGGPFDSFKLTSSGPEDNGFSLIAFDNVLVQSVPEPATILPFGLGLLILARLSIRHHRATSLPMESQAI
jgi:hypothetical protein